MEHSHAQQVQAQAQAQAQAHHHAMQQQQQHHPHPHPQASTHAQHPHPHAPHGYPMYHQQGLPTAHYAHQPMQHGSVPAPQSQPQPQVQGQGQAQAQAPGMGHSLSHSSQPSSSHYPQHGHGHGPSHGHGHGHGHGHSHSISHAPGQMGPPNGMPPPQQQQQGYAPGAGGAPQPIAQSVQTPNRRGSHASQASQGHIDSAPGSGSGGKTTAGSAMQTPAKRGQPDQSQSAGVTPAPVGSSTFSAVMQAPAAGAKVYASVYSGIPVFEAMIRGISVMRRTSDSWVNATQILKVAGVPKSARTKILEKEVLVGEHEKVQGGYGKYQGTWIPFTRGQELAAQYGVTAYLSPIFDFVPSPANVAALPVAKADSTAAATPDRPQKTPLGGPGHAYNALLSGRTPTPSNPHTQPASGRMYSPMPAHHDLQPPPHFMTGPSAEGMMLPPHPMYGGMYYAPGPGPASELAPAAELNGYGLAPSHADVYVDAYGQPHSTHYANGTGAGTGVGGNGHGGGLAHGEAGLEMAYEPPTKRVKYEEDAQEEGTQEEDEDMDSESEDVPRNGPPVPSAMRLSTRPIRPKPGTAGKARSKMMALFHEEVVDVREFLGLPRRDEGGENGEADTENDIDIDVIIDDQGHTALHWACALARMNLVAQLIELGADIHRGNYAGETALVRSVLTTNHLEANTFPALMQHLSPAIRTLDHAHRTVVHHIALVAGVKGRAPAARTYMTAVLGWVARAQQEEHMRVQAAPQAFEQGHAHGAGASNGAGAGTDGAPVLALKTIVDVQDVHGDTALNVAARVGNKGLVNVLLDAGADKARANKLGLKPVDFGIEVEALKVSPGEAVVSGLKGEVPRPERQSRDVQKNIAAIFETINETFSAEMVAKQTKLNGTEQAVRSATRALAEKRQAVARAQASITDRSQVQQRSENLRRAIRSAAETEWSGRGGPHEGDLAFRSSGVVAPAVTSADGEGDARLPEVGAEGAVVDLRRMLQWEDRALGLLQERIEAARGKGTVMERKYRRLVGLCAKVPEDKVDGMLDGLVAAIESDGNAVDWKRVGTLMSRIKAEQV